MENNLNYSLKTLEVCKVPPLPSSCLDHELSLPLTFSDFLVFGLPPPSILFFYSLPQAAAGDNLYFFDFVIPKLKHSLSLTLQHFLPFAGNLTLPHGSQKPLLKYTRGDGASFTVAQSHADFTISSRNRPRKISELLVLIPGLHSSKTKASTLAVQVTLFPTRGFSIGIVCHHGVADGRSVFTFVKAWTYLYKYSSSPLLQELRPFLDRTVIKDPQGLDMNSLIANETPMEIISMLGSTDHQELVQTTFTLTSTDIVKLRKRVLSLWNNVIKEEPKSQEPIKLSTFVLASAYLLACIAKAIKLGEGTKLIVTFLADCRAGLEPPIDPNYFGNCLSPCFTYIERDEVNAGDGIAFVSKKIRDEIKIIEKEPLARVEGVFEHVKSLLMAGHQIVRVAGSPRFGAYETDFGWGKPLDMVMIPENGVLSLVDGKDGEGGVEVGLCYSKHEMEIIAAAFHKGLRELSP